MDAERGVVKIAFGCTIYARALQNRHLDGIGYYANELATRLATTEDELHPLVFGPSRKATLYGRPVLQWPAFGPCALASALTGCSFPGNKQLQRQVDLVHATDHLIPKFKGTPVLATLMDAIPLSHPEWANSRLRSIKNLLWKKTSTWADHIVTVSEYAKTEIINHFHVDEHRISVVPLGVDERFFQPIATEERQAILASHQLPPHYFLFIGTLQPRKNLNRVIQAHQSLPTGLRKAYPLVIIGRAGWGCEPLIAQLRDMPASEPVHWLGGVDDKTKRALLQQASALVFASLSEGFGLPVLEAYASGTPVIASNTTSVPEVAGQAALLVDPLRTEAIAHAMQQIIDDSALAAQLAHQGLTRSHQFTWDTCAEKTRAIYRQMLS